MPYRAYRIIFRLTLLKYYKIRGARIGSHTYLGPNVYLDVNHRPGKIIIGKNSDDDFLEFYVGLGIIF